MRLAAYYVFAIVGAFVCYGALALKIGIEAIPPERRVVALDVGVSVAMGLIIAGAVAWLR